jgi:hypothetical protein
MSLAQPRQKAVVEQQSGEGNKESDRQEFGVE